MMIINVAHPITDAQREQVAALAGRPIERVLDVKTQCDHARPFVEQVQAMLADLPLEGQGEGSVERTRNESLTPTLSPEYRGEGAELRLNTD